MGATYHQFCPIAKAMELLDERWTILIIRELISGSNNFNDLRRGLPRISPSLLSKRLRQLILAGIVEKPGDDRRYLLTEAGRELRSIIEAVGAWGIRWIGELGDHELDPKLLLWDMHRNINHAIVPAGRSVIQFSFTDTVAGARDWWLVIAAGEADVCDRDPGFPVTATVSGSLRGLTEVWRGDVSWLRALRDGTVEIQGTAAVRRSLPHWFSLSSFAPVSRPVPRVTSQPVPR